MIKIFKEVLILKGCEHRQGKKGNFVCQFTDPPCLPKVF